LILLPQYLLLVVELLVGGRAAESILFTEIVKHRVCLAHAFVTINEVGKVGKGVHRQDGGLAVLEPCIYARKMHVLVLYL